MKYSINLWSASPKGQDQSLSIDVESDDRNQVVDMWRSNGIDCIQVVPREQGEF